jgi:hypothetical protein
MSTNVTSLTAYRTLKEYKLLFRGYEAKMRAADKHHLLVELENYRIESRRYPSHLLTIVKGQILLQQLDKVVVTPELKHFVVQELARLRVELSRRLRG